MASSSTARRAPPSPLLWLWTVLLVVGIFSRPTAGDGNRELTAEQGAAEYTAPRKGGNEKCWIFTHMPKSGGSTIKTILNTRWGRENVFLYNSDAWKLGEAHAATFSPKDPKGWRVVVGGYSEVLRRHGGNGCKWFTLFRHPIDRVVSAYYYCHKKPQDQACASSAMVASEVDLLSFAKMWGNFAVRQFSLGDLDIETVMRVATSPEELEWPAWYMAKEHFMKTGAAVQNVNVGADAALHEKVQFTQDLLRDEYSAVGILEEFNTTMALFDHVLDMPKLGWGKYFDLKGVAKKNKDFASVKDKALEAAHNDDRIKHFLRLDIELYDYAVGLFHKQLASAGLSH